MYAHSSAPAIMCCSKSCFQTKIVLSPSIDTEIEQIDSNRSHTAVEIEQSDTAEFRVSVPVTFALEIEHFKYKIYYCCILQIFK